MAIPKEAELHPRARSSDFRDIRIQLHVEKAVSKSLNGSGVEQAQATERIR